MKMLVKKWGNSAAVRIPASVLAASSIAVDQAVKAEIAAWVARPTIPSILPGLKPW